mgnify:FL=1
MSLISLKSLIGQPGYDFSNHFMEGITLKKGTQFQLVNMTINKEQSLSITNVNNTFIYRLGNITNNQYYNHHIILRNGVYTQGELAQEVQHQLNESTVLGQFKNQWKVSYDAKLNNDLGGYHITYGQITVLPTTSGPAVVQKLYGAEADRYAATQSVLSSNIVINDAGNPSDNFDDLYTTIICENGAFCNGGNVSLVCRPNNANNQYHTGICGVSRNMMVYPERGGYDNSIPRTRIQMDDGSGDHVMDYSIKCTSNALNTCNIIVSRLAQVNGTSYPEPGWYNMIQVLNISLDDAYFGGNGNFTLGQDRIKISVSVVGVRNISFWVEHDKLGDGFFIEAKEVVKSGTGSFNSTIRESFYPLIPVWMLSGGIPIDGATPADRGTFKIGGIFDDFIINSLTMGNEATRLNWKNSQLEDDDISKGLYLGTPEENTMGFHIPGDTTLQSNLGADLNLRYFLLFQILAANDPNFAAQGGPIPDINFPTGVDNICNAGSVLGMEAVYFFPNTTSGGPIQSTRVINYDIQEPSLMVELPDFNIKCWNGTTGDIVKAISMVPKEEMASSGTIGTLHYTPQYPVPISLNLESDQTFNQIRVRLRDSEGKLETTMLSPTQLIIYVIQPEEEPVVNKLLSQLANIQNNKISQNVIQNNV